MTNKSAAHTAAYRALAPFRLSATVRDELAGLAGAALAAVADVWLAEHDKEQ